MRQMLVALSLLVSFSAKAEIYTCNLATHVNPQISGGPRITGISVTGTEVVVSTDAPAKIVIPTQLAELGDVDANDNSNENYFWAGKSYDTKWQDSDVAVVRGRYDPIPFVLTLEQDFTFEGTCTTFLEILRP